MRTNYIIFQIRFHSLRKGRISIGVYGKYRAVRHIPCAFGVNIDLHIVPSSSFARALRTNIDCRRQISSRVSGISIAPLAQISIYILSPHPPSPRRRSPFSTKLGKAERAKVEIDILFNYKNPAYKSIIDLYAGFLRLPTNLSAAAANLLPGLCHRPCRRTISSLLSLLR